MPTETIPFEILGHFEEIIDIETGKCYGCRPAYYKEIKGDEKKMRAELKKHGLVVWREKVPQYGYCGRSTKLFHKGYAILIDKAHKGLQPYRFKADANCMIITHPICGRMKTRETLYDRTKK